jgi:ABC-type sulfate transport system permease component
VAVAYLSLIALLPLAAVVVKSTGGGLDGFWRAISNPQGVAALKLTLLASLGIVLINAVFGTLIAWVLVRDEFPGKGVVNALIDLPFALPTIVASLTLLALYGPNGPFGVHVAYTRAVGEFGSLVLITGNVPFKTQVSSVFIYSQIESGDVSGAAAVSVVLLLISFVVLLVMGWFSQRILRHDDA